MTAPTPRPDAWTAVSLGLLAVLAVLLLLPLLGGPLPSPWVVAALLLARLGVQVLRARTDERLRRPASWAFDLILIGLLFYTLANPPVR
ncbi:hypothetical protein HNQ07_000658 [Deinococcus metalli]|uniref:Uncharacterized protein n=1 Tax=Deinococcus metalli TaxID=1141878 RepID=A0A7W8NLZ5_9DEIO|nr:hypothetical protein [Deinococcus metalli]MBB5375214.1 hypothetical protein [Deinococcus metalli]GHF30916.1 hypothetical protein GCM10017781_03830 [Deinococcus metalli]